MEKYFIKYGDKEFPASEYQSKIFDFIVYKTGNLVINACAGSSKTTTIINCLSKIDSSKKVLFVAFNKSIVEEINDKLSNVGGNIKITTFHGLGLSLLIENGIFSNSTVIDEYKYKNYVKKHINELSPLYSCLKKSDQYNYINSLIKLIEYSRYFVVNKDKRIQRVAEKYGVTLYPDEIKACKKVLQWGKENLETLDYTDMVWLPNVLNLTSKWHVYDYIFIDEGQDTSIMEEQLIKKCYGRGVRTVVVGDIDQQINVWAGANEDAFNNFINQPNTVQMELPICYRCPKKIISIAQEYSKRIMPSPDSEDGVIRYDVSKNEPVNKDMVLCRTTAPLIELHLRYIRLNKKSYIKGSDEIKNDYLSLINATDATDIDLEMSNKEGLISQLYINLFKFKDKIMQERGLDDEDAIMNPDFLRIYDAIEAIKVISEGINTVSELKEKIKIIFPDNEEGITLSTVHKAKGLEADNVYILYPSLMPSRMAKSEWEKKSEQNLLYVATTRAKKSLNYMEESGRWSIKQGYMDTGAMMIYLSGIADKLGYKFSRKIKEQVQPKKEKEKNKNSEKERTMDIPKKFSMKNLL